MEIHWFVSRMLIFHDFSIFSLPVSNVASVLFAAFSRCLRAMGLGHSPPRWGGFTWLRWLRWLYLTDVSNHLFSGALVRGKDHSASRLWSQNCVGKHFFGFFGGPSSCRDFSTSISILISLSDLDRWLRRSPPESGTDSGCAKLKSCRYVWYIYICVYSIHTSIL